MAHVTEPAEARRRARRPTVSGRRYVVAAGHAVACVAGQRMLESSGNAIDAGSGSANLPGRGQRMGRRGGSRESISSTGCVQRPLKVPEGIQSVRF